MIQWYNYFEVKVERGPCTKCMVQLILNPGLSVGVLFVPTDGTGRGNKSRTLRRHKLSQFNGRMAWGVAALSGYATWKAWWTDFPTDGTRRGNKSWTAQLRWKSSGFPTYYREYIYYHIICLPDCLNRKVDSRHEITYGNWQNLRQVVGSRGWLSSTMVGFTPTSGTYPLRLTLPRRNLPLRCIWWIDGPLPAVGPVVAPFASITLTSLPNSEHVAMATKHARPINTCQSN